MWLHQPGSTSPHRTDRRGSPAPLHRRTNLPCRSCRRSLWPLQRRMFREGTWPFPPKTWFQQGNRLLRDKWCKPQPRQGKMYPQDKSSKWPSRWPRSRQNWSPRRKQCKGRHPNHWSTKIQRCRFRHSSTRPWNRPEKAGCPRGRACTLMLPPLPKNRNSRGRFPSPPSLLIPQGSTRQEGTACIRRRWRSL